MSEHDAELLDKVAHLDYLQHFFLDDDSEQPVSAAIAAIAARLREPSVPLDVVKKLLPFAKWFAERKCHHIEFGGSERCGLCLPCKAYFNLAAYDRWQKGQSDE